MGDERTNEVYLDDVWVSDDYVVGELNHGFQYISEALDLERFTLFTYSPIAQRLELLTEYVATATRDGEPLKDDAVVRQRIAQLAHRGGGRPGARARVRVRRQKGGPPPTSRSLGVQAVRHRVLAAVGRRLDGHRRPGWPAPGPDRGRPDGRAGPSRPTATR